MGEPTRPYKKTSTALGWIWKLANHDVMREQQCRKQGGREGVQGWAQGVAVEGGGT